MVWRCRREGSQLPFPCKFFFLSALLETTKHIIFVSESSRGIDNQTLVQELTSNGAYGQTIEQRITSSGALRQIIDQNFDSNVGRNSTYQSKPHPSSAY